MKQISLILSTFSFAAANIVAPTLVPGTSPVLAQTAGCGSGWSNIIINRAAPALPIGGADIAIASRQFRVACDEHDACYETFGKAKQDCENAFHNRMLGICARDHNTILGRPLKIRCNGRADAFYAAVRNFGSDAYDKAQAAARPSTRFKPGFYSRVGMNPPGIIYLWPSPWDGAKTDVWCDVPNHSMYARNIDGIGRAIGVNSLEAVKGTAKYWSQPCTDDIFRQSRIQR
jgi:Group XII secretory phospholipase A2 precursor (PLA2G12)